MIGRWRLEKKISAARSQDLVLRQRKLSAGEGCSEEGRVQSEEEDGENQQPHCWSSH